MISVDDRGYVQARYYEQQQKIDGDRARAEQRPTLRVSMAELFGLETHDEAEERRRSEWDKAEHARRAEYAARQTPTRRR